LTPRVSDSCAPVHPEHPQQYYTRRPRHRSYLYARLADPLAHHVLRPFRSAHCLRQELIPMLSHARAMVALRL